MDSKTVITGGVAGFVGAALGLLLGSSGVDMEDVRHAARSEAAGISAASEKLTGEIAGLKEALAALDGKIDAGLETAQGAAASAAATADNAAAAVAESAAAQDLAALKARIEEVSGALTAAMSTAAAEQSAALKQALSEIKSQTAVAVVGAGPEIPAAPAEKTAAAAPAGGLSVGQTATFGDGAMRVFVSRVQDGAARLSVGGESYDLAAGETVTVADCALTLDAASGGQAALSGACGDELPAPEGLAAGNTVSFQDGAIRVTVSRVDHEAKTARLSINGETVGLNLHRTALVDAGGMRCGVTLDAVDRGHAALSTACGGALQVSDMVAPGKTVSLGDGAARVFLSSADDQGARFAVNGQSMHKIDAGGSVAIGSGCTVSVEQVKDGQASFGYSCE